LARTFDFVATAAPGVREILTVGKLCWEVKEHRYDLVVVDASSTGHIIGQLDAPRSINGLVQVGRVRNQTRWMLDILEDPLTTGVVIVTTPEEMPVVETIELCGKLRSETSVDLAAVVVNRALPELFTRSEASVFEAMIAGPGGAAVRTSVGAGLDGVVEATQLSIIRRRMQAEHLDDLRSGVPGQVPLLFVPELFARMRGMRATATIADRLAEEL
jgi:anion-transporting  ArsA/GET3 family ATPase